MRTGDLEWQEEEEGWQAGQADLDTALGDS